MKVLENKQVSGSLIDLGYVKKTLIEEFSTNATVKNIYFSDHDGVRIIIEKNAVDLLIYWIYCFFINSSGESVSFERYLKTV